MVSKQTILGRLPAYRRTEWDVVSDQSVEDIMCLMEYGHNMQKEQYDRIAKFFIKSTVKKTLKNIFDFLKKNTCYVMESKYEQTVKEPAAILMETETYGNDCKNYSMFAGGIIDAINRSGRMRIPFAYRFVTYVKGEPAGHVFVVAFPETDHEVWLDATLDTFDTREPFPYAYFDVIPKNEDMLKYVAGPPVRGQVSGLLNDLLFASGLKNQLFAALPAVMPYMMYMYLPDRADVNAKLTKAVSDKRGTLMNDLWNMGAQANIKVETELFPYIRNWLTQRLGMSPEEWWNIQLPGWDIRRGNEMWGVAGPGQVGGLFDFVTQNALATSTPLGATMAASGGLLSAALSSFGPNLKWKNGGVSVWGPAESDWDGTGVNPIRATPPANEPNPNNPAPTGKDNTWGYVAAAAGAGLLLWIIVKDNK